MPRPDSLARPTFARLALFALLGWALVALARRRGAQEELAAPASPSAAALTEPEADWEHDAPPPTPRSTRRRLATSFAFTTLFFAGAAFSAGAGDVLVQAVENDCEAPAAEMTAEQAQACAAAADSAGDDAGATDELGDADDDGSTEGGESPGDPADGTESGAGEGADEDPGDGSENGSDEDGSADPGDDSGAGGDDGEGGDAPGPTDPGGGDENEGADGDGAGNGGGSDEDGDDRDGEPAGEPILEPAPPAESDGHEHDHEELDPEASTPGTAATVWLHRDLGDPLPVARRLAPGFAKMLAAESRRARVDWAVVHAAIRATGGNTQWPASRREIRSTARQIRALLLTSSEWQAFLALTGRTPYADRATALMHYNRAVGLRALVTGFEAAKPALERATLGDPRLAIYAGGRADIAAGRIDVRVLVLLRYMAEAHGQVTVSSLHSGHRLYARPGVVSAHVYGLAVDIAGLAGQSVLGNSAPGGLTEEAVRNVLLLPNELRPRQVISLLGLGGPSFPAGDHADHIHVGF